MNEITPTWTMKPAATDKFTIVFYCPFCDKEQTFDLSEHNIQVSHINHWVARHLHNHVLDKCTRNPRIILIRMAEGNDDDAWNTSVVVFQASRAGRNLLRAADGYLYHLSNDELLEMARDLESRSVSLLNRANNLRDLI